MFRTQLARDGQLIREKKHVHDEVRAALEFRRSRPQVTKYLIVKDWGCHKFLYGVLQDTRNLANGVL